jgi:hypothetical protein
MGGPRSSTALERRALEAKLIQRCWRDETFRRALVSDPAATIAAHTGMEKASLPNIVVHEEPAGTWHIVLPAAPTEAGELSDEELERIAGGVSVLSQYPHPIGIISHSWYP